MLLSYNVSKQRLHTACGEGNPWLQVGGRGRLEQDACRVISPQLFQALLSGRAKWLGTVSQGPNLPEGVGGRMRCLTDSATLLCMAQGGGKSWGNITEHVTRSALSLHPTQAVVTRVFLHSRLCARAMLLGKTGQKTRDFH